MNRAPCSSAQRRENNSSSFSRTTTSQPAPSLSLFRSSHDCTRSAVGITDGRRRQPRPALDQVRQLPKHVRVHSLGMVEAPHLFVLDSGHPRCLLNEIVIASSLEMAWVDELLGERNAHTPHWWRHMLLPPRRLTPIKAIALTVYGASVRFRSDCSKSC